MVSPGAFCTLDCYGYVVPVFCLEFFSSSCHRCGAGIVVEISRSFACFMKSSMTPRLNHCCRMVPKFADQPHLIPFTEPRLLILIVSLKLSSLVKTLSAQPASAHCAIVHVIDARRCSKDPPSLLFISSLSFVKFL